MPRCAGRAGAAVVRRRRGSQRRAHRCGAGWSAAAVCAQPLHSWPAPAVLHWGCTLLSGTHIASAWLVPQRHLTCLLLLASAALTSLPFRLSAAPQPTCRVRPAVSLLPHSVSRPVLSLGPQTPRHCWAWAPSARRSRAAGAAPRWPSRCSPTIGPPAASCRCAIDPRHEARNWRARGLWSPAMAFPLALPAVVGPCTWLVELGT
jgi:hypothetical protein